MAVVLVVGELHEDVPEGGYYFVVPTVLQHCPAQWSQIEQYLQDGIHVAGVALVANTPVSFHSLWLACDCYLDG